MDPLLGSIPCIMPVKELLFLQQNNPPAVNDLLAYPYPIGLIYCPYDLQLKASSLLYW